MEKDFKIRKVSKNDKTGKTINNREPRGVNTYEGLDGSMVDSDSSTNTGMGTSYPVIQSTGEDLESHIKADRGSWGIRILFAAADLIIELDEFIARVANSIFRALPERGQDFFRRTNNQFKSGRNRVLGLEPIPVSKNEFHGNPPGEARVTPTDLEMERGDVPGWVLVVLMTTGLVTALWTIAAPRLSAILKNSLDTMNNIR